LERFWGQSFIERDFERIWLLAPTNERSSGDDKHFLKTNFADFYNAVFIIRESARKLLPEALESQIHNPAVGMYVAFIKLYQKVQHKLNRFTAKHLEFY
jgi:hypothetical protein